ncbi:UDP-N-acetylmuramoyl-L-alanine--D-glutamate ligase, partial [Candidatus Uhrbacteria bacterium]|nr:UDP-N-acetylmuramoyl-L-alanine--D-glutamate ligase [Candidatus Uhrbacteria bacterium]
LSASVAKLHATCAMSGVRCVFGKHRKSDFTSAEVVIQNPAVPRESPFLVHAEKAGAMIENEATLFFRYCKSKNIIGVTGTRGKSTTAAMIARILRQHFEMSKYRHINVWFAGNIRTTPMLSIVDRIRPDDWVVLELSSWHLENMGEHKISPHIAVVTNVLDDHMNRYRTKRAYAAAKENIVRYQRAGDIAVLNNKNVWTKAMAKTTNAKVHWFDYRDRVSVIQRPGLRKFGAHDVANAQAAATTARAVGVPLRIIRSALCTFRGLPDRQEIIGIIRGVTYVNDTTATTPDATIAALQRFAKPEARGQKRPCIVLICGGTDKNLNYKPLIPWIKKTCKAVVLLPGSATEKIKKYLNISVSQYPFAEVGSMRDALAAATKQASHGDVILLSPAAASFGLFQHEFDRGNQFKKYVPTH